MASCIGSKVVVPTAGRAAVKKNALSAPKTRLAQFRGKTVSNGAKVRQIMVWTPNNNKYFETLSYLPALSTDEIAKQIDYVTRNGWTPCLEFAEPDQCYVDHRSTIRFGSVASGFQDNRYWVMWRLPMFGTTDASQVLKEIADCQKTFPTAFVRLVAFDRKRQIQIAGFLVSRPEGTTDYRLPDERSV